MALSDAHLDLFGCSKPVIGMVHLPPLPSGPSYSGLSVKDPVDHAVRDAEL